MATDPITAPIFSGRYRHVLDKKHRITIPARWRTGQEQEFFLLPDQSNSFLMVMPPEEFRKWDDTVAKNEKITPQERRIFQRWFYSSAVQCFADKQGRLLIPEEHFKQAGLKDEGEVVIAGSLSRFEIWNGSQWDETFESGSETSRKVADLIGL